MSDKAKGAPLGTDGCGGLTRSGGLCKRAAGAGTDHLGYGRCSKHGGSTPTHRRAAQGMIATEAVELYGLPREVDPFDALLEELARTAGHVDWLRLKVGELPEDELTGPVGTEGMTNSGAVSHARGEANVWVRLYQEERTQLVRVAATCIKAGIEERRVELAEEQGRLLAKVIDGVLGDLDIPAEKAAPIVRKHLALVAG